MKLAARARSRQPEPFAIRWCRPSKPLASSAGAPRSLQELRAFGGFATALKDRGACRQLAGPVLDQQLGNDRTARLKHRKIERRAAKHSDVALHEDRIAVPPNVSGVELEQAVGMTSGAVEHPLVANSKVHRFVHPVAVDELVRNCRAATANALVGLLKGDDIGVDFLKHLEHTMRIAPPVEADRLVHIIAGKRDRGQMLTRSPIASQPNWFLNVEVCDAQRIVLNELAPRFDHVAHQPGKNLVRDIGLRNLDPKQRSI